MLTGGPGAGKTASLEVVKRCFPREATVLPEAASIVFGGGFPRDPRDFARSAAQRAIFSVQRELETIALDDPDSEAAVVFCDRGTLDGAAYFPGYADDLLRAFGTTLDGERARYEAVLHLRPASEGRGYDHSNPVRIETAEEAIAIDARIEAAWAGHPRRCFVDSTDDFLEKVAQVIELARGELARARLP